MTLAMSGAAREDAGLASGLVNTTAQVGGALGLAVLATLSATRSNDLMHAGKPLAVALTDGYHLAFVVGAVLVFAAIVVAITIAVPRADAAAERPDRSHPAEPCTGSAEAR
jgi:NADH:ubiquinone oxidoreductase subunit 6 (subunit J)